MRGLRAGLVAALAMGALGIGAEGQAIPAAIKPGGISIFGGISRVSAGYSSDTNYGATIGADFTRYYRAWAPSLEVRYSDTSGPTVGESTLEGGLKIETGYRRFRPYADFLFGYGSIIFQHPVIYPTGPYSSDNSFIYGGGGGVDYRIRPLVALKVDVQEQIWNIGSEASTFRPVAVTVGVSVNLPFQGLRGRR